MLQCIKHRRVYCANGVRLSHVKNIALSDDHYIRP